MQNKYMGYGENVNIMNFLSIVFNNSLFEMHLGNSLSSIDSSVVVKEAVKFLYSHFNSFHAMFQYEIFSL